MLRQVIFGGLLGALITTPARADCSYNGLDEPVDQPFRSKLFPEDDLFRPLLADNTEHRFTAGYRRMDFDGPPLATERVEPDAIDATAISAGGSFGLWSWRRRGGCDGLQVNVAGGVFSYLNHAIRATTVMNSDYFIDVPIMWRSGNLSARLSLLHMSSHLGDEFLYQIPDFTPVNLGYEMIDLLGSYDGGWWRLYGGGAFLVHSRPWLDRFAFQWGLELRGPTELGLVLPDVEHVPVLGVDMTSFEARDWGVTTSIKGGMEVAVTDARHRFRLLGVYLTGYTPFGQFFVLERVRTFGVESHLEF